MRTLLACCLVAATACATASPGPAATQLRCPAPLPLQLFEYDASQPLDVRDSLLAAEAGVEVRSFSFASPKGGRATGLLARPTTPGPHAGIVSLTGFPANAVGARASAIALARTGAVVAVLWPPSARPDGTGRGSPVTFTAADSAHHVQFIVEIRRLVDLLAARPDVDASRIGLVGGSYGGSVGAHVAGVEPRLRAAALFVANAGFVTYFTGPEGRGLPEELSAQEREAWLSAMRPVQSGCYVGRARAALLLQNGESDRLVPPAQARQLHVMAGKAADVRWYPAGHALGEPAGRERLAWLARQLGTTPPVVTTPSTP